jgi:hypothetical protein
VRVAHNPAGTDEHDGAGAAGQPKKFRQGWGHFLFAKESFISKQAAS